MLARVNQTLSRYVNEQRIYIRTEDTTRYFRISPLSQVVGVGTISLFICWTIVATSALVIDRVSAQSESAQADVLQAAYEKRLEELTAERDTRALEAQRAQERFYVSLEQVSLQQEELLSIEEERRELATGLKIMQRKLQGAIADRDEAVALAEDLRSELQEATGTLSSRQDAVKAVEDTLAFVTRELEATVSERDSLAENHATLSEEHIELTYEQELMRQQGEFIFSRLEEAAEVTLSPLESALNREGINTEQLLESVRRGYTGTGGPIVPLMFAPADLFEDPFTDRANDLLIELDRINLMKIAAGKIPLLNPVRGSYRWTSGYGFRRDPFTGGRRMHSGVDMAGPMGTPIVAAGDGVVTEAGWRSGYGRIVIIKHAQGFESYYAHLNKIRVTKGEIVSQGDRIGDMGTTGRSTGVHLHYEIRIGGKAVNPMTYLKAARNVF
ncbi:MAG: DUF5930 domain-containing protein [Pseudomonadota bacterium]